MPVLFGLIAAGLALVASLGGGDAPPPKDGAPPKAKPKTSNRRMSSQEAFDAGKKARDAELKVKADEDAAFNAKVDAAVKARAKSEPPAPPPPKKDEGAA